jgi:hypothetical protein
LIGINTNYAYDQYKANNLILGRIKVSLITLTIFIVQEQSFRTNSWKRQLRSFPREQKPTRRPKTYLQNSIHLGASQDGSRGTNLLYNLIVKNNRDHIVKQGLIWIAESGLFNKEMVLKLMTQTLTVYRMTLHQTPLKDH